MFTSPLFATRTTKMFAIFALLAAVTAAVRFPDRSTRPLLSESALETIALLPNRPGNIDVDSISNRVFFTFHPMSALDTDPCKVCELINQTLYVPFGDDQHMFSTVLSVRVSPNKRLLYALDHKNLGQDGDPVLYQFDINTQALLRQYTFSGQVAPRMGNLNDFCLSKDENFAFVADVGILNSRAGVITVNLVTGAMHRSLDQHESTKAKPAPGELFGGKVRVGFDLGVDSIAISANGNMVYFGAVFDTFMWMVPTSALVTQQAESRVDIAFPKPCSDGIIVDEHTNLLFVTDFQHDSIWVTHPDQHGRHKTLVQSSKLLRWPDGLSILHQEGKRYLYITASAIHELMTVPHPLPLTPPYHILRIDITNIPGFKDEL